MRKFGFFVASLIFALALSAPAKASTIYYLDIMDASIGSGVLGTVTLTQVSANQVDVVVDLADKTAFVSTGGKHHAFAYNLDLAASAYAVTVTSPSGMFSLVTDIINTPYGTFLNGMDCTGCGPGASASEPGPLMFTVFSLSGISISDFIANKLGYYFSADVIGPAGGTGNIASDGPPVSETPLPAALPLFVAGIAGAGLGGRKMRRRA